MLSIPPPDTTAERQRRFQERHPGYDRRRKAQERALAKRGGAQLFATLPAQAAAAAAATAEAEASRPVLMPAPIEDPVMAQLNAVATSLAVAPAREPLPITQQSGSLWFVERWLSRR